MANDKDILVENLKETLKGAQAYLLTGTGAALFLLVLAAQGKLARGAPEQELSVPFVGFSAPTFAAAILALAIYVLSGVVVLSFLAHSRRIQKSLGNTEGGRAVLDAVMTYPSILTMSLTVQVGAAVLAGLLGAGGLLLAYYGSHGFRKAALTAVLFPFPYFLLAYRLWSGRGNKG